MGSHMIAVECPQCRGINVSKNGTGQKGMQRYFCNNKECPKKSFMLKYIYNGCEHGIESKIITNTANAQGIRDIARSLKVSNQKVLNTLKKQKIS